VGLVLARLWRLHPVLIGARELNEMKKIIMLTIAAFYCVVFAYLQKTGDSKNIIAQKGSVFNDLDKKEIKPVIEEKENGTLN